MNKTISINLGGRNFFIEEDAFAKLDSYLNAIKARFSQYTGSEEIVADMESRIGEKFLEKHENNSQSVITEADVVSLISELGSVEDIAGEAEAGSSGKNNESNAKQSFAPKRLMRNGDDKIIAGVASGLAAYLNISPTAVRIVFGVLFFAWGAIIPIYILLWIIMPEAKTPSEKMQMKGEPFNLGSINETVKERAEEFKAHVKNVSESENWKNIKQQAKDAKEEVVQKTGLTLGGLIRSFFQGLGMVIKFAVKAFLKIVSFIITFGIGVAITVLTITAAFAIFNPNSAYIGLPLNAISHTTVFYVLLVAAYLIVLIPLEFILLLSVSLMRGRRVLTGGAAYALFSVWFLAIIVGAALGGRYVPEYVEQIKNSPQYQINTKIFTDLRDFNKLDLGSNVSYKLEQGSEYKISAKGREYNLDALTVNIENGALVVGQTNKPFCIFCEIGNVEVDITAPNIQEISLSNSADLTSGNLQTENLTLNLSNSSSAQIDVDTNSLNTYEENSSDLTLTGLTLTLKSNLQNSSSLYASDLIAQSGDLELSNSSEANVNVVQNLKYTTENSSSINYTGHPIVQSNDN